MRTSKKTNVNIKIKTTVKTHKPLTVDKEVKSEGQKYVERILLINKFAGNRKDSGERETGNIFTRFQGYSFG